MGVVTQETIADGSTISVSMTDRSLVSFDFLNDTAFNVGIAMGRDVGFNGADYIIAPHSVLQGIAAPGVTQRTLGGQYWGGTIYVYGQNPPGGTTPTGAPANAFTIIGYGVGQQPLGGFGINRLQNIGNNVNTNMGGSNTLQNDNNAANTQFIEATQTGSPGSNVSVDNSANLALKQWVASTLTTIFQVIAGAANGTSNVKLSDANHQAEVLGSLLVDTILTVTGNTILNGGVNVNTIRDNVNGNTAIDLSAGTGSATLPHNLTVTGTSSLDNGAITTDGTGVVTMPNNKALRMKDTGGTAKSVLVADSGNSIRIVAMDADQILFFSNGGSQIASIDTSAAATLACKIVACGSGGNFQGLAGTLSRFTFFTGTGSGTYAHSQGVTPQWVCAVTDIAGSATQGYDSGNSSTVHITLGAANAFKAFVVNS